MTNFFSYWFLSHSFFMMPVGWPSSDSGEYDTWSFWAIYSRVDKGNYGCFLLYHCFKLHTREVVGGSASIDTSYSPYGLTKSPTVWNCGECCYAFDSHVLSNNACSYGRRMVKCGVLVQKLFKEKIWFRLDLWRFSIVY